MENKVMAEKTRKEQLIEDIEKLLNSYNGVRPTSINPSLLQFMDEDTLVSIIDSLLDQKEENANPDEEWLEKFKTK
jgi:hypothetical protein